MIGIFGGSFDPIHHAHLLVAQAAREALGLDEVRFLPAREQPFKRGRHGATAEQRAAMVALAVEGEPGFRLDRTEVDRPGPSYTVETLRLLHDREPGRTFALLIGADAVAELDSWREVDHISRLARIVVVARPGAAGAVMSPRVWRTVPGPALEISATEIRRRVRAGLSIRYWVPPAVAAYIAAERLYRDGEEG